MSREQGLVCCGCHCGTTTDRLYILPCALTQNQPLQHCSNSLRRPPSVALDRQVDVDHGHSVKPGGPEADIRKLHRVRVRQIALSVLRNVGCWTLIGAILTIGGEGTTFTRHFEADANRLIILFIILIGALAITAQVYSIMSVSCLHCTHWLLLYESQMKVNGWPISPLYHSC
jgi:hypothetical protein